MNIFLPLEIDICLACRLETTEPIFRTDPGNAVLQRVAPFEALVARA